jgi:LysR family transcriptional regulator, glycine cleavage system transcriptional activator
MNLRLPPLHSLQAFEAAARHLNLSAAAEEMHVTKGAISLQVKKLEEAIGLQLFDRAGRKLKLTSTGETYFRSVNAALQIIRDATENVVASKRPSITVSCTPGFAVQWLVPRLSRLEAVSPDLDIRIRATNAMCDFMRDGIDFAVRHGRGSCDGLTAQKLFNDDLIVVAAPQLRRVSRHSLTVADLKGQILLHDEHRGDWQLWLEAAGLSASAAERGPVFEGSNAVIEAALAGRGLALVPLQLVKIELAEKRLMRWWAGTLKSPLAYYLVYPEWVLYKPRAAAFRDWLIKEVGRI